MVYEEITDPFRRLVRIMERLQEPDGCPWDIEQTHQSLKPYLIEEAYETLEAIDSGDDNALAEELGDVLLQVVFHSALAKRTSRFTIDDVVTTASSKMVRRHPHVFGDVEARTAADVLVNWEKVKSQERKLADPTNEKSKPTPGTLDGVPKELPALLRAQRIQEKAARTGFDWPDIDPVLDKVVEETAELKQALKANDSQRIQDELGDLLFTIVNLARFLKVDAEDALRGTCNRFQQRFSKIEQAANDAGKNVHDLTLEEMDQLWESAKSEQ